MAENSTPFITVTVQSYNYGHLLPRALNALAAQSFRDFEIIVVDNGSTDNTPQVAAEFAAAHPDMTVRYVRVEQNIGIPHGRNTGLDAARGQYVMVCDADDWAEPDCLELLAARAKQTGSDRVLGQYREVSDTQILRERPYAKNPCRVLNGSWHGSIFKRSVIEEHHIRIREDLFYAEDYYFILMFTVHSKTFSVIHQPVFDYYFNVDSLTSPKMYDPRKRLHDSWGQLVDVGAEAAAIARKNGDTETADQIEYLLIKHYYPALVTLFCQTDRAEGRAVWVLMRDRFLEKFPRYRQNKMLVPWQNGHPLSSRVCCWGMALCEGLHLLGLVQAALRIRRPKKLVRV